MLRTKLQSMILAATLAMTCGTTFGAMFYATDDVGSDDSRLVQVNYTGSSFSITDIGPTYKDLDIEGMAFHPMTGMLYAVGGDDYERNDKFCYTWDIQTGILTNLGTLGGSSNPFSRRDIIAAAFRSNSSNLWISVEDMGLYEMDLNTLQATLRSDASIFSKGSGVEGMVWTPDGRTLLAGDGEDLYAIDLVNDTMVKLLTLSHDIEGLGYDSDGNLLATKSEYVTRITMDGGTYSAQRLASCLPGSRDFEALASPYTGVPEPATMLLLTMGGAVMLKVRRRA